MSKRKNTILVFTILNFLLTIILLFGIMIVGSKFIKVANNMQYWKDNINANMYENREKIKEEIIINRGWIKELERIETIKIRSDK